MSGPAVMGLVAFHLALGGSLILLGRWGRDHATSMSPLYLDEREREIRSAVVRRGGLASILAGALIVLTTLLVVAVNTIR